MKVQGPAEHNRIMKPIKNEPSRRALRHKSGCDPFKSVFSLLLLTPLLLFCSRAPGQSPPLAGTLDSDRLALYRDISSSYDLDGRKVPTFVGSDEDVARLALSSDLFVKRVAQQCLDCNDIARKAQAISDEIQSQQDQSSSTAEPLVDGLKFAKDEANDDLLQAAHEFFNSGTMERIVWNNVIQQEKSANISQKISEIRHELVQNFHDHPRGIELDSKSIALDFTNDNNSKVLVRLRNDTGQTLHNCMVVADVNMDGSKVDAEEQANATSDSISMGLIQLSNPSKGMLKAQLALVKSNDHINRSPEGVNVFVPEWLPGQWIEANLVQYLAIRFASPGVLNLAADEGFATPISLPVDAMAAATLSPASLSPVRTPEEIKVDEETLRKQSASVTETGNDGVILYQFLSYPDVWSEAIVLPPGAMGVSVRWADGMNIRAMENGRNLANPARFAWPPEARLRFMSSSRQPVPTAVRIMMRQPTPDEKQAGFAMPPWPAQAVTPTPDRQAMLNALLAILRRESSFSGTLQQGNASFDIQAKLAWDDQARMVAGWINYPSLGAKKKVEGRIMDDGTNPLYLQLIETGFIGRNPRANVLYGMYYALYPASTAAGQFAGHWQLDRYKGTLSLRPAAP